MTMSVHLARLLVLAVIFVNGWTDAPGAIATAVGSGAMSFRKSVWMAAACNFIGAAAACLCFPAVADTIGELVAFSSPRAAVTALNAALLSIVLWAVAAWRFGLPTSESHALLAGLSGGALALGVGAAQPSAGAWLRALSGLALSLPAGMAAGRLFRRLLAGRVRRPAAWQRAGAALTALLHGVQDGQKFMGVFLMGIFLAGGRASGGSFSVPLWMTALCSVVMAAGTAAGGERIIKKVGMEMVRLEKLQGIASDAAAAVCLLFASWIGIPVSTTHVKTTSIMGVGLATDAEAVDMAVIKEMLLAWVITFPCCGLIGYITAEWFGKLV